MSAPGGGLSTAPTVTIATAVGRFPGGVSGRTEMSRLLSGCGDAISEVPAARWVLSEAMDVTALSEVS